MLRMHAVMILLVVASISATLGLAGEEAAGDGMTTPTVFYFHGDRRCVTCRSIERTTHAVVQEEFAERLRAGALTWKVVNYDEKENRHYVKALSLTSSGVVIARVASTGEITEPRILQKVWPLSRDETRMRDYLVREISDYLGARP